MNESTYELIDQTDPYSKEVTGQAIKRIDADGSVWFIPTDPANSDYQAYCVWAVAEGLMEAPVVVEPQVTEPEPVIGTDPEV